MLPPFHKIESNEHLKKNTRIAIYSYFEKSFFTFILLMVTFIFLYSLFLGGKLYLTILTAFVFYISFKMFYPLLFHKYEQDESPNIVVDEKGFHKDRISILYDDLANDDDTGFGVHLKWIEKKQMQQLVVYFYQRDEKPAISYEIQSGLTSNKPANKTEIIARFLLGVAHFSPHINIDPAIFEHYGIDNSTYKAIK
jgi:hypothetical protein